MTYGCIGSQLTLEFGITKQRPKATSDRKFPSSVRDMLLNHLDLVCGPPVQLGVFFLCGIMEDPDVRAQL